MPFDKLYVKIKCSICTGTRKFEASGYHSPNNPYKWKQCPYCDKDGATLVEAGDYVIMQYLIDLPEERRDKIIAEIKKIPQEK